MSDDKERMEHLENVLAQMLRPVRGVPFSVVVKSMSDHAAIAVNPSDVRDKDLIAALVKAAKIAGAETRTKPILRPRPNEVGNDVEPYVMRGVQAAGLKCERPKTKSGQLKATGYPDILVYDATGRPTYLECKIYGEASANTSMRSFYLSPSDDFKVTLEARHLLIAFEMEATPTGGRDSEYRAKAFKLIDLHDLDCDVKYEFNSDNRRLYAPGMILAAGPI